MQILLKTLQGQYEGGGAAVAQCATNRKAAGSIPGGVIGFFIFRVWMG